jgi:hypothetical protein
MRYWLGVVSRNHVERGVAGSFAQLCHGKEAPLRRMQQGDWLVYYSPSTEMRHASGAGGLAPPQPIAGGFGDPPRVPIKAINRLQAFTALGQVADDRVYQIQMAGGWAPHWRKVRYEEVQPVPLARLAARLHLTRRPHWGMALWRGHLELDEHDFTLIAGAMRVAPAIAPPAALGWLDWLW